MITHTYNKNCKRIVYHILSPLQKAFDTLDHYILHRKMKYLDSSSKTIGWFDSYLKNRIIIVSLDKILSDKGELNFGVPQGSILGPIFFYCMSMT